MKNLKKLASIALAAILALALMVPAFAAEAEYKITIENPVVGETYNFYKIFDLTISGTNYDYTATEAWIPFFAAPVMDGETVTTPAGPGYAFLSNEVTDQAVTIGDASKYLNLTNDNVVAFANAATAYAKDLAAADVNKTIEEADLENGQYTQGFTSDGYYLVFAAGATQTTEASNGSVCILTNTNPQQAIKIKSTKPTITKTAVDADGNPVNTLAVGVGADVPFTITGTVPNTTGYDTYTYQIVDTMGVGLTYGGNSSVTVKVGDVELTEHYSFEADPGTATFVLNIDVMALQDKVGETIEVTYTATVNGNALNDTNSVTNTAELKYDGEKGDPVVTPPTVVTVYLAKIDVLKHNSANEALEGAKFVLQNDENKYYKYTAATTEPAAPATVEWVDAEDDATVLTTNSEGKFDTAFVGLGEGTYTLVETEAPAGYNKLADGITVKITPYVDPNADETDPDKMTADADKVTVTTDAEGNVTKTFYKNAINHTEDVLNLTGAELPETGGIGTTIFYTLGGLLVVGAGILLVVKKRMGVAE